MIATAHIGRELDLEKLSDKLMVEWEPESFPAVRYHLSKPRSCVLLFTSGSMVCTGCKSKIDVGKAIKRVTEDIGRVYKAKLETPRINIKNIVAYSDFSCEIDLERASSILKDYGRVIYEPEIFPGLSFWPYRETNTSILLFRSGKAICAGAKEESTICDAFSKLEKILKEYSFLER
jgi:transcription initiation factor TFIID TATA-box-binding protein